MSLIQKGSTVQFKRPNGTVVTDVVRCLDTHQVLLQPYAENYMQDIAILTQHSWMPVADLTLVQ